MASAAQSAANRLNAQESTGPRTSRGKAALRRNPSRHPPAELGSTAPPTASGPIPRESLHWVSRGNVTLDIPSPYC
jgi:hypothetical protein